MTKSKWSALALLIAAFVLGALSGGAAMALADRGVSPPERGVRGERVGFAERLERDLSLTSEQRQAIDAVLERYRPTMDSLWREVRPQFETVRAQIRSEITALLTPEQQQQFAELEKRREDRRHGKKGRVHVP